jgi:hypothetical protein
MLSLVIFADVSAGRVGLSLKQLSVKTVGPIMEAQWGTYAVHPRLDHPWGSGGL